MAMRGVVLWAVLLLGVGGVRAGEVDAATFAIVDRLLGRFDADGSGTLEETERVRLEEEVARRWGRAGSRRLVEVLGAADADGDGRIARSEWASLADRLGFESAWGLQRTVFVEMSDGVKLATDVYLPPGEGPFPTVLSRTPYGRNSGVPSSLLRHGYVVVRQDMRGRFASEGENLPFVGCGWTRHRDGAETIAWIGRQPWSNSKVATLGGSALGITQNLLAPTRPEGLVCQHISVAAASLYHHAAYVGGALRKSQVERWLEQNAFHPDALRLYRAHPSYDAFWQDFDATRRQGDVDVPALHQGGWFDTFSQGTIDAFTGRQLGGAEGARGRQVLVMGPWAHGGSSAGGLVGQLRFPNARLPAAYSRARFFDHHLKGEANGVGSLKPVAIYVMGDTEDGEAPGNEWRFADAWPIPATATTLFLHVDGVLSRERTPGYDPAFLEYTFDPEKPCPTIGGCNLTLPKGPEDQRMVEQRDDVLVFSTRPLDEPIEVTGNIEVRLFVSSSARDTDLSVRFCDVYPDGRSFLMAEGMLRLRFRAGFEMPKPLTPHEVEEVVVRCWPTSIVVNRGHRIRISITSSNFPRFDVNPGTGRPGREGGRTVEQTNRIYCDAARPSAIVLPVVP